MNGLANAILTLLLSWLRIIINRFWALISSESGTSFYTFLANHWLSVLLVLLVGGYLLDRIIYLIRWRPFRVWMRRRGIGKQAQQEPDVPMQRYEPAAPAGVLYPEEPVPQAQETVWPAEETNIYHPQPVQQPSPTAVYPRRQVDRAAYMPPIDNVEPVFDEEETAWAQADQLVVDPQPTRSQPAVSDRYMQDVQAGFARPVAPEQLYPSFHHEEQNTYTPDPQELPAQDGQPVHPGLDTAALRLNMGLAHSEAPEESYPAYEEYDEYAEPEPAQTPYASGFTPFTQKAARETPKKSRNPFLNLMRLVGEDSAKPSIHDLQSTVDVRTAFHEPVFPNQNHPEEDE